MATECYAMVRGSAIRVTGLTSRGVVPAEFSYAISKSITSVQVNEVVASSSNEVLRNEEDQTRLRLTQSATPIRFTVDVDFLRVDPGILSLVSGVTQVLNAEGNDVGFDATTRRPAMAFALEVWSKIAGQHCSADRYNPAEFGDAPFGDAPFGGGPGDIRRRWGYTVFPFLRGGYLSGFKFANGLVSFNLRNAQTRRPSRWAVGPYDLEGPYERMAQHVSRNAAYRSFMAPAPPPLEAAGVQYGSDIISGGTSAGTSSDVLSGGTSAETSSWIISGGEA